MPTMLSVEEVASRWSVSAKTIYGMIQRREIVARKIGRILRIPRAVVELLEQASAVPGGS